MGADKVWTWEELSSKNDKSNIHVMIHGQVYDLTEFLDEHPGGDEVLLGEAGKDATEAFEDVGHSDEARKIMDGHHVGVGPEGPVPGSTTKSSPKAASLQHQTGAKSFGYLLPLALLVAYFSWKFLQ